MEKKVNFPQALLILGAIVIMLVAVARTGVSFVIGMALTWIIIFAASCLLKFNWNDVFKAGLTGIHEAFGALIIVGCVGMLIGTWLAAGTIPYIITLGLKLINPKVFFLCCLIVCSLMSVFTGTSGGSVASAGVAMMGIGTAMGMPVGPTAGAIICGSMFGDKMSPLSDTTNVCPALVGGTLFRHIQSMLYTTVVPYILSCVIFTVLGFKYSSGDAAQSAIVDETIGVCNEYFVLNPICLIPLVLVIILLLLRVDTVPAIFISALSGVVVAMLLQGVTLADGLNYMYNGFSIDTGNFILDKLLNRGGLISMAFAIFCTIFALGMGGMLEYMGVLHALTAPVMDKLNSVPKLVALTAIISYLGSAMTTTMTSANAITGKIMAPVYREKGVAPEVCSRTMEDCGTLAGPLFPWHSNSIQYAAFLGGISATSWIPYLFLSWMAPIMAMICAFTGIGIWYINKDGKRCPKEEHDREFPDAFKTTR